MPNWSRAQNSSRVHVSQIANANIPRSRCTTSLPSSAYISSRTSESEVVRSVTPCWRSSWPSST